MKTSIKITDLIEMGEEEKVNQILGAFERIVDGDISGDTWDKIFESETHK